jgi:hypothetical protein
VKPIIERRSSATAVTILILSGPACTDCKEKDFLGCYVVLTREKALFGEEHDVFHEMRGTSRGIVSQVAVRYMFFFSPQRLFWCCLDDIPSTIASLYLQVTFKEATIVS